MLPAGWTGRETGASLSNDRCVLIVLYSGHKFAGSGANAPRCLDIFFHLTAEIPFLIPTGTLFPTTLTLRPSGIFSP